MHVHHALECYFLYMACTVTICIAGQLLLLQGSVHVCLFEYGGSICTIKKTVDNVMYYRTNDEGNRR
jgi:hypothetical protein